MYLFLANPQATHEEITGFDFPFLFCATDYRRARESYPDTQLYAAQCDWSRFFAGTLEDRRMLGEDRVTDALASVLLDHGVESETANPWGYDALWDVVVQDIPASDEEWDVIAAALDHPEFEVDETANVCRFLRHDLAVALGYAGSLTDDDAFPITIEPATARTLNFLPVDRDPEEDEEDENGEE